MRLRAELRRQGQEIMELRRQGQQQNMGDDALGAAGGKMERTRRRRPTTGTTLYYGEKLSASSERSFKGTAESSSMRENGSRETETLMGNGAMIGGSLPINPRYGSIEGACGGPGAPATAEGGDSVSGLRSRAVTREEPTFREDGRERHVDPGPVRREQQQGEELGERF